MTHELSICKEHFSWTCYSKKIKIFSSDLHLLSNQPAVFNSLRVRCVGYSWLDTMSCDVIPIPSQVRKMLLESGSYYAHNLLNKPALILLQILPSLNFIHNSVNYFTGISLVGIQKWAARVQNQELWESAGSLLLSPQDQTGS